MCMGRAVRLVVVLGAFPLRAVVVLVHLAVLNAIASKEEPAVRVESLWVGRNLWTSTAGRMKDSLGRRSVATANGVVGSCWRGP